MNEAVERPPAITVYEITGKQLFFTISESFCKACDPTIHSVKQALREIGHPEAQAEARSHPNHLPAGGYGRRSWELHVRAHRRLTARWG